MCCELYGKMLTYVYAVICFREDGIIIINFKIFTPCLKTYMACRFYLGIRLCHKKKSKWCLFSQKKKFKLDVSKKNYRRLQYRVEA